MLQSKYSSAAEDIVAGTIILIDEAQTSYGDSKFWNRIIKSLLNEDLNFRDIRVCLFSSYGSPSTGVECVYYTPAHLGPQQRVTLTIQPKGPAISLFFTVPEAYDAMDHIVARRHPKVHTTLDDDAKAYLFSLTNGHPGGIKSMLDFILAKRHSYINHGEKIITKDKVLDSIKIDENDIWTFLENTGSVFRSFPTTSKLTKESREVLVKVLETGSIEMEPDKKDEGLERCYRKGWLHKTLREDGAEACVLPSRLHEKWVEHLIGQADKPLPSHIQSLRVLIMTTLRGFSSSILRASSAGKILSSSASYRPVEAQYQDEFYRAFNQVMGRGVSISSEWSRTRDGRVDFWIKQKKWAIELLRDHNRIDEHIARFHKDGKYYDWIKDNMVSDWIVVNCATSMPAKASQESRLIHAIFDPKYEGVHLLDNRLKMIGYFVLTN
ncbi:hypothetical protein BJX63DRAFT_414925 [Aspergillus granulosus]|uniref:Uncharacterized protein n=1 Tax=Aspergillus granulosus TaxID=176169 RepID=A0ABR4GUE4_9EURO